jgi:7-cyano-7-deazaguanine synthase
MGLRVLLYSGGMDSVIAHHLLDYPARVYVRIGAPYEERELASFSGQPVIVVDGGRWLGERADRMGRVPLRNLYFAVAAAAATGADEVILGATAGETSPDKSREFAREAGRAMSAAEGRRIRLSVPYRNRTKTELVRALARACGPELAWITLRDTPACYLGTLREGIAGCGQCMSCVRRWVALELNGYGDRERYAVAPWTYPLPPPAELWPYVWRTPMRDWPGIIRVNRELAKARAMRGVRGWR